MLEYHLDWFTTFPSKSFKTILLFILPLEAAFLILKTSLNNVGKKHQASYSGIFFLNDWAFTDSTGFFLFPFWFPLERGASMKLPVSLQFLYLGQSAGRLGRVFSSSQDLYLHRTTQT
jgi:hypothetical protein